MRNSEFLSAVYGRLKNDYGWTTSFASDPGTAPGSLWLGSAWTGTDDQKAVIDQRAEDNNYYSVGVCYAREGDKRRSKEVFGRLAVLMADDISPVGLDDLVGGYSYALETSKGNYQVGVLLDPADSDTRNAPLIDAVLRAMGAGGFVKADSSGNNPVRYARLPVGTNTKKRDTGMFSQKLLFCNLDEVYTLADAVRTFSLDLDVIKRGMETPKTKIEATGDASDLVKAIITPNLEDRDYHDPLLKLSASLIAGGLRPGATVNVLRSLMLASKPEGDPAQLDRWQQRFGSELTRMVSTAEKYAPKPEVIPSFEGYWKTVPALGESTKNIKWLVKNLIPADSMGMIFGASGTFKSFIALDLCLSVANGKAWTGRKTDFGAVGYMAAEGGAGIYKRIIAWQDGVPAPDRFQVCTVPLLLSAKEEIAALRKSIIALPEIPKLIVIDTLSQTFSGDENSSSDIATYLRMINSEIREPFGATVLVIHHSGHSASERPRGSSAITANVDFLLGCFRSDPEALNARLEVTKQKDGDKVKGLYFDLERRVIGCDEEDEEISSLVAVYHDAVASIRQNAVGSKYDVLIMQALMNAKGGQVMEEQLRQAAMTISGGSRDNASRGIRRSLKELKAALRIREGIAGTWMLAD
jgi:hypothetical protein